MTNETFIKSTGDNKETIYIKPYEVGVTLAQKVDAILRLSKLPVDTVARVLDVDALDLCAFADGEQIPDKVTISAINKLYRLWYEHRAQ